MSNKAIFALSYANNRKIHQIDMKTAFLYNLIEDKVWDWWKHNIFVGIILPKYQYFYNIEN